MPPAGLPEIPGFQISRELGRGATSRVYLARQEALQRDVALKVITTLGERGRRRALRLFREARLTGALDHPNIVRGIDAGEREDFCWFAMEYVPGGTLLESMERSGGRLDPERVARIGLQLLGALDHAHDRGVVHRDLKPANLLIDVEGRVHLLDLGLARHAADTRLTQDGGTVGTPQYMAPEQAREARLVDARSDLFSVGATLYHALTGIAPFEAETVANVLTRLLYDEPEPPSQVVPGVAPAWDLFFHRALAKEPKERYQAAVEMARDLRSVSRGLAPARAAGARAGSRPSVRLIVVTAVVVVLALAALVWKLNQESAPDPASGDSGGGGTASAAPVDPVREAWRTFEQRLAAVDLETCGSKDLLALLAVAPAELPSGLARAKVEGLGLTLIERLGGELVAARRSGRKLLEAGEKPPGGFAAYGAPSIARAGLTPELSQRVGRLLERERAARERIIEEARDRLAESLEEALRAEAALLATGGTADAGEGALRRRLENAMNRAGPVAHLDDARRDRLRRMIREMAGRFVRSPLERYERARKEAEGLLESGQLVAALSAVEALEEEHAGVGSALATGSEMRGRIKRRTAAIHERARALERHFLRRGLAALPPDEWVRRRDALSEGIAGLPDSASVAGLEEIKIELNGLLRLLRAAIRLEAALPVAASRLAEAAGPVVLKLRRHADDQPKERILLGLDEARAAIKVQRARDGFESAWALGELVAASKALLLKEAGVAATPLELAAWSYFQGEDDRAEELHGLAAEGAGAASLASAIRASLKRYVDSRATEPEREAARCFLDLRRALAGDDLEEVKTKAARLAQLEKRHGRTAYFREEGAGVNTLLARARGLVEGAERAARARERFGFTRFEAESGRGFIEIPVPRLGGHPSLKAPPGARDVPGGIRVSHDPASSLPPWDLPPLRIELPARGVTWARVELTVTFPEAQEDPSAIQVSLFDLGFLGIGSLKETLQYRGEPLHGLERQLYRRVPYDRAVGWVGQLEAAPKGLPAKGTPLKLKSGKSLMIVLEIEPKKRRGTIMAGGKTIPLPKSMVPRGRHDAIEIRGFPTFEVSRIFIEVEARY